MGNASAGGFTMPTNLGGWYGGSSKYGQAFGRHTSKKPYTYYQWPSADRAIFPKAIHAHLYKKAVETGWYDYADDGVSHVSHPFYWTAGKKDVSWMHGNYSSNVGVRYGPGRKYGGPSVNSTNRGSQSGGILLNSIGLTLGRVFLSLL